MIARTKIVRTDNGGVPGVRRAIVLIASGIAIVISLVVVGATY